MPDTATHRIFVQTAPGLEPLLAAELGRLGIRATLLDGGAEWEGAWPDLFAANLYLRTASRVLVEIGRFGARALGELERKVAKLDLGSRLPEGDLQLRVSCSRSRLSHRRAVEERVRAGLGRPADEDAGSDATLLLVRIHRDQVTLRLDSSGEHLHRRGYRTLIGGAPLRETLAAATLLASGWLPEEGGGPPAGSAPAPGRSPIPPLADPFCGSGTIPIEAALLAAGIPPGLARPDRTPRAYAFTRWPGFPSEAWGAFVEEARAGIAGPRDPSPVPAPGVGGGDGDPAIMGSGPAPEIMGSDRDPEIIDAARANARAAGVGEMIRFEVAAATSAPLPDTPGWIVTNPPYGGRLGDRRSLKGLYRALGGAMRGPWAGWRLAMLAGDPALPRHLGIPLDEAFSTPAGGIRVRLFTSRGSG